MADRPIDRMARYKIVDSLMIAYGAFKKLSVIIHSPVGSVNRPVVTVVDYKAIREVDVSSLTAQIAFAHDLARYQPLAKSRISRQRRRMRAADRCCHILACRKV